MSEEAKVATEKTAIEVMLESMSLATAQRQTLAFMDRVQAIEEKAFTMAMDLAFKRGGGKASAYTDEAILQLQERIARQLRRRVGLAADPPSPAELDAVTLPS